MSSKRRRHYLREELRVQRLLTQAKKQRKDSRQKARRKS